MSSNLLKNKGEGVFNDDFLLSNDFAKQLYHDYASKMPIIDYHNHLNPEMVANDEKFSSITQLWLQGDHYKWRALRANGVNEKFITGESSDWEKFEKWAATVPQTLRNPLFHWTHLELKNPFGIQEYLNPENAKEVFNECNKQLSEKYSVKKLLSNFNVQVICTTDDPTDNLEFHSIQAESEDGIAMYPTFRCDRLLAIDSAQEYKTYLIKLGESSGVKISKFEDLLQAMENRHQYFHSKGTRLSDVGFGNFPVSIPNEKDADSVFTKFLKNSDLTSLEVDQFKSYVLHFIGILNHKRGWVQQLHVGPLRNNNSRGQREVGADGGFDSMGDGDQMLGMSRLLDALDSKNQLAKTIAYNLNPANNDSFATMLGNFNDGTVVGKMQFGSGWWFLDQKSGMEAQMQSLSNMGLLSRFVGMLTDSRSFVSFSRHEYFRRILCNLLGVDMANGEIPTDVKWVGKMVQDICYNNAKNYFDFTCKKEAVTLAV